MQGKGSFVAGGNMELLREERLKHIEDLMARAVEEARSAGVAPGELHDMLDLLMEDDRGRRPPGTIPKPFDHGRK